MIFFFLVKKIDISLICENYNIEFKKGVEPSINAFSSAHAH